MRGRSPPSARRSHLAQVAVAAGLSLAAATAVLAAGEALSHDLREALLRVTPRRALVGIVCLALVLGVWSLLRGGAPSRWRRRTPPAHVPVVAVLGLILVAAATFRILLVRAATEPRVLGDELVYSGLAKSFALDGLPLFRGELYVSQSLLYPLLLSPAHVLAADGAAAFEATKVINAVVVVAAAVPAYLLARRVARAWLALVVAALVALEPWTAYASLVMTESLFLPAFTTFVLVFAGMLERPTPRRQIAALVALVLLVAVRPQAAAQIAALVAAVVIVGLREPPLTRTLRAHAPLLLGLGAAAGAALLAVAAGADVPGSSAADVWHSLLDPVGLVTSALQSLAVYELAVGVVAVGIFPLAIRELLRSPLARARATGVALLTSSLAIVLSGAAVAASPSGLDILHERYVFYLTPLVLVALAAWLDGARRKQWRAISAAAVGVVALAATVPGGLIARANDVDSPAGAWIRALHEEIPGVPTRLLMVGLAAIGALTLVFFRTPVGAVLSVVVACAALTSWLDYSGPCCRDDYDRQLAWVDRALPPDARATIVHLGYSRPDQPCADAADYEQQGLVVWTEFFNTRVNRVFHVLEQVGRDNLPSPALTVGAGGVVLEHGRPFGPRYVVLDSRQPVVGTRLARLDLASLETQYQDGASLSLWAVEPPLRFLRHAQPLPPRADGLEC